MNRTADRWFGAGAILICAAASLCCMWVNFTLSDELYGFRYSIGAYSPSHHYVILLSFGVIAVLLLVAAAAAVVLRKPDLQCVLGGALLLVVLCAYLRIALGNADLLMELGRQSNWWTQIFSGKGPSAIDRDVWSELSFNTIYDRLYTGWYYLGLGWYLALFASLSIFATGARNRGIRSTWRPAGLLALLSVLMVGIFLYRPAIAEREFENAVKSQVLGRPLQAISQYREAMRLDDWYALNPVVYVRVGQAFATMNRTDTPEYQIYRAEQIYAENQGSSDIGDLPEAIGIYKRIAGMSGRIGVVARIRAADLMNFYGFHLFQSGAFGQAVEQWDEVFALDPDNWLAAYYVGQGYPTVGRYRDLATVSQRFIDNCSDPLILGILYSNLGDANTWLGQLNAGHRAYYHSYDIDYAYNMRGIASLVGP